jgi:hypothetical protein
MADTAANPGFAELALVLLQIHSVKTGFDAIAGGLFQG